MSTRSNAVAESSLHSSPAASHQVSAAQIFIWSVQRELWEHRSIYLAPLATAAVAFLGFIIATIGRGLATPDLAQRRAILEGPFEFATGVIMAASFLVSIFYSLDALHGERRDRSVLFWKSLPVSDLMAVLAKAGVAMFVIPMVSFVVSAVMEFVMALLSSAALSLSGLSVGPLWAKTVSLLVMLLYHLLTVHALWYAPFYSWLLLASAWARRAVFLWAALPPLLLLAFERIVFGTWLVRDFFGYFISGPETHGDHASGMGMLPPMDPGGFLLSPGLWMGLLVATLFLFLAVRLRRVRGPI